MIAVAWLALALYAEQPSTQIQWLQSGVVAALVTALVMGAVSLRNQRVSAAPENRRVTLDEFKELKEEYREKIAEQAGTIQGLERDLEAVRLDNREKSRQLDKQGATIANLTTTVSELRIELERSR